VGEELPESMSSKSKKKKKKEFLSKKNKADPNAPSASRIPLPELKVGWNVLSQLNILFLL